MNTRCISVFAALTAMLAGAPALAAQNGQDAPLVRHQVVHTADLDLSTSGGVAALHRRVARATSMVCRTYPGFDMDEMIEAGKMSAACRAQTRAQADQRVAALVNSRVQLSAR